jgi:hypothetical protein
MAEVALRGTALLFDLQMETARSFMHTQARTAALFGAPDYSQLFRLGDDRARRLFAAGAEQMLSSVRQARETLFEVQREIGRLAEQQTIGIAEEMRERMEEMTRHTEEGLQEIKQVSVAEGDHVEDVLGEAMRGDDGARGAEGEQGAPEPGADASHSERHAQGLEHIGNHDSRRAANEAPGAESATNPESTTSGNEPPPRERERGRARR